MAWLDTEGSFFLALHLLSNMRGSTGEVWMRRMKKEDKSERGRFMLWIGFGKLHKILNLYYMSFYFSFPAIMLSCVKKRRRDKKSGPRSIVTGQESVVMDRIQTMKYLQTHCQLPLAIERWDQIWNREGRGREKEREREEGRERDGIIWRFSLIHEQVNCAGAKKTAYPGVQVFGWWYAAYPFGEGSGLCTLGQGRSNIIFETPWRCQCTWSLPLW